MTVPMTRTPAAPRRVRPAILLTALTVVAVVVALLTPEAADNGGGQLSSYSVAPGGARLASTRRPCMLSSRRARIWERKKFIIC